nr:MAG TPA: hypothetical protein [Caudoviricetes sp.]
MSAWTGLQKSGGGPTQKLRTISGDKERACPIRTRPSCLFGLPNQVKLLINGIAGLNIVIVSVIITGFEELLASEAFGVIGDVKDNRDAKLFGGCQSMMLIVLHCVFHAINNANVSARDNNLRHVYKLRFFGLNDFRVNVMLAANVRHDFYLPGCAPLFMLSLYANISVKSREKSKKIYFFSAASRSFLALRWALMRSLFWA